MKDAHLYFSDTEDIHYLIKNDPSVIQELSIVSGFNYSVPLGIYETGSVREVQIESPTEDHIETEKTNLSNMKKLRQQYRRDKRHAEAVIDYDKIVMNNLSPIIDSWEYGDENSNITCAYHADASLTISGNGKIKNLLYTKSKSPWKQVKIEHVTILSGITEIGHSAFYRCSMSSISLPDTINIINSGAFKECFNLKTVTIPESVERLGEGVFEKCVNLEKVFIGKNVLDIGDLVFNRCENLYSINVSEDNLVFSTDDGILYNKDKTQLISCPNGKQYSYAIPPFVSTIKSRAFQNCNLLESIVYKSDVLKIEYCTYKGCSALKSIIIPNSVTIIEREAFAECTNLSFVVIGQNVTDIGECAFTKCTTLDAVRCLNPIPPRLCNTEWLRSFERPSQIRLFVPKDSVEYYCNVEGWKEFKTIEPITA